MRDFAIVKKVEGQRIEVVSLLSAACIACPSADCAKSGSPFHVINKKNLPLKENDIIRIAFPRVLSGILGLISLLLPLLSSVLGYILVPYLSVRFDFLVTPRSQAFVVGIFFTAATLLVVAASRTNIHLSHPEVVQIM